MPILGFRHTANFVTNERPEELAASHLARVSKWHCATLRANQPDEVESTDDPVFHWWQKNFDNRRLKFTGALSAGATAITIDATFKSAFIVKMGDMLLIEGSGEIVVVTSDPTDSYWTGGDEEVRRGLAGLRSTQV